MATAVLQGRGCIEDIVSVLEDNISKSGITNQLIYKAKRGVEDSSSYLLVFEKFYYRNSSRASLSIMVTEVDEIITVDVAGSGGGQGVIFRFNWGAESNFVSLVSDALLGLGFKVISSS
ncbi:MAG: DUF6054 family protein [Acholeplasmataceae bacterium]|nr:DUF6054 family protein [Acholeplasmataceae bacterium]